MKSSRRRAAFTLVEVLLVVLIIAALAAVVVTQIGGTQDKAKIDLTKTRISKVMSKVEQYHLSLPYPTEDQGLMALVTKPSFDTEDMGKNWAGPYLNGDDLKDEWSHALVYKLVTDDSSGTSVQKIHVYSIGPNGNDESGEGDDIKDAAWASESAATK